MGWSDVLHFRRAKYEDYRVRRDRTERQNEAWEDLYDDVIMLMVHMCVKLNVSNHLLKITQVPANGFLKWDYQIFIGRTILMFKTSLQN